MLFLFLCSKNKKKRVLFFYAQKGHYQYCSGLRFLYLLKEKIWKKYYFKKQKEKEQETANFVLVKIKDIRIFYFNKHWRSKLRLLVSYTLVFGKLQRLVSLQSTYLFFSFTQLLVSLAVSRSLLFFWDTKQKRLASKVGIPLEHVSLVWFDVLTFWDTKLKRLASEKKKKVCFLCPLSKILTSLFSFLRIENSSSLFFCKGHMCPFCTKIGI